MDERERPLVVVGACGGAPVVWLFGQGGPRLELAVTDSGTSAHVALKGEADVPRVMVRFGEAVGGVVQVFDRAGKEQILLGGGPGGECAVQIADAGGRVRVGLHWRDGLPGMVTVMDATGQHAAGFGPDFFDDIAEADAGPGGGGGTAAATMPNGKTNGTVNWTADTAVPRA
jgi:hypothetical protein